MESVHAGKGIQKHMPHNRGKPAFVLAAMSQPTRCLFGPPIADKFSKYNLKKSGKDSLTLTAR